MRPLVLRVLSLGLASLLCTGLAHAEPPNANQAPAQAAATDEVLIDLNTASASQLEQLPGVGPSRAQAILAFRTSHGGFTQVSQLMRIKGIGRAMLRKLRPLVTISALPASAAKPELHTSR